MYTSLIGFFVEQHSYLRAQICPGYQHRARAQKHLAVTGDCHRDRVFFIRIRHRDRIACLAISTAMDWFNMGVITMKMMSTTSITSTIGVTLISDTGGGAFFCCMTISLNLLPSRRIRTPAAKSTRKITTRNTAGFYYLRMAAAPRCDRFRK